MKKILHIATREFLATVVTKGFVIGVLLTPALIALMVFLIPRLITEGPPKIEGEVAILDQTGNVAGNLALNLTPQRFVERRAETQRQMQWMAGSGPGSESARRAATRAPDNRKPEEMPQISTVVLPAGSDVELEKIPLKRPLLNKNGDPSTRLAVVVIHHDALKPEEQNAGLPCYDLFVRNQLDDRLVEDLHTGIQRAIGAARLQAAGLDSENVVKLLTVKRAATRALTAEGEQKNSMMWNSILPIAFMVLLLISILTSGQMLLTTVVEEKSNRVVEVLLSAVSPIELMTGKILGQMAVGFLILVLYAGLGILALTSFAMLGLLKPSLLLFLFIFYVLAYFTISAIMAAIGSAVSELRDAQNLMMPVMLCLMLPWFLMMPISRDPNSMLSVTLSFIPPIGNFVMLLRMASNTPPALWQVWLSILISAAGVYVALRFAAKVFRVGLLMFGKPPTFGTLIRWARIS
jgi:ABC-2 type transport system permease protein